MISLIANYKLTGIICKKQCLKQKSKVFRKSFSKKSPLIGFYIVLIEYFILGEKKAREIYSP